MIESEFPRSLYPQVFECLLAIHQAQEESLAQLGADRALSEAEILRITCAKGGASVLADACMAHGSLNLAESRFAFQWGVLLQLGDDLQDVTEDLRRGSATLFTRSVLKKTPLDSLVTQLLHFSERVAAEMDHLPHASNTLKELLRMSLLSLIVGAVAESHHLFTPEFLAETERTSPFRFDFIRNRRAKLTGKQNLFATLFHTFLEEDTPEPSLSRVQEVSRFRADPPGRIDLVGSLSQGYATLHSPPRERRTVRGDPAWAILAFPPPGD
jgi:hypothetical protein